jgi:hypothetical protein
MNRKERYTREQAAAFVDGVRQLPCLVCGKWPVEAHHLRTRGSGGSDRTCVPLCLQHHAHLHFVGLRLFEKETGAKLWDWNLAKQAEVFGVTDTEENRLRKRVPAELVNGKRGA